jgi:hypothetical protein
MVGLFASRIVFFNKMMNAHYFICPSLATADVLIFSSAESFQLNSNSLTFILPSIALAIATESVFLFMLNEPIHFPLVWLLVAHELTCEYWFQKLRALLQNTIRLSMAASQHSPIES